jgi:trk system potassium uptake protein TrkA
MLPEAVAAEWTDASGRLMLLEQLLPDSWAGQHVRELVEAENATLVAVTRAGEPRLDVSDIYGQEGDVLHIAVMKESVGALEKRLGRIERASEPGGIQ